MISTPTELGGAIRCARKTRGWTQAELAQRSGLARQTIIRIEAGNIRTELLAAFRVLRALELAVDLVEVPPIGRTVIDDILDRLTTREP
ncbi:MAG TPA: helix-turn-helix domain-containing protein [Ilumatobacter sp.]|nr:helix-turn-helix domain-containing protein [Ilumatobacter sp.]